MSSSHAAQGRPARACPTCGHVGHPTAAVGRFSPGGPLGYVDAGAPTAALRGTRDQAAADVCARQATRQQGAES